MQKIAWGILGCARVARQRWIPAIVDAKGGNLLGIASRSEQKAAEWADSLKIPRAYGSYQALLDDPEIQAVYIGLANHLHCEWVIRSLQAGKHVLCDKPLGLNADEAQQMVEVAEQCNCLLIEGFMYQYHPQHDQIRQWIQTGALGSLRMLRACFAFHFERPGNYRNDKQYGGGALLDVGCYCVHVIRKIIGREPQQVMAWHNLNDSGADWSTQAMLDFGGGVRALFDCSFDYQSNQFLYVAGTQGQIHTDWPFSPMDKTHLTLSTPEDRQKKTYRKYPQFTAAVEAFQELLTAERWLPCPARDSIANLTVLDAIAASARSGQVITLDK